MIIGEKNTDLKRLKKHFAFWQKLGDFIETKAKKSPTSPGLMQTFWNSLDRAGKNVGPGKKKIVLQRKSEKRIWLYHA